MFDEVDVRPIEDPVEAVAWVEQRAKMHAEWRAERVAEQGLADEDDPAHAICLTERDWLVGFLTSRQAPSSTMTFEMLDGMLTALVIGPAMVLPSEYVPEIWGTDNGTGPEWTALSRFSIS